MEFDIDNSTKIIIGLVTAIAGAAMHFRSERVKNADALANVAESNLKTTAADGQAEEIIALRDRLNSLDAASKVQDAALSHMLARIAVLEAAHIGVSMHVDNLLLCEVCTSNNEKVLMALHKALDGIDPVFTKDNKAGLQY